MATVERDYAIHGERLRATTGSSAIAEALHELLAEFPDGAGTEPALELRLDSVPDADAIPPVPSGAERAGEAAGARSGRGYALYRDGDRTTFDFPSLARLRLDAAAGRLDGWLVDPENGHPEETAELCRISILELLRLRGLNAVHASAVEKDGRGILIAGASGRGKTTACLALVRAGYRCLSDDHPLLRETAGGLELLPFRSRARVTEQTVGFFPELGVVPENGLAKRPFLMDEIYGPSAAPACRPDAIIFPRLTDWPTGHLERLAPTRALEELLPQALLALDRDRTAAMFRVLTRLVRTAACYRLHFGRDVVNLPSLFETLFSPTRACA